MARRTSDTLAGADSATIREALALHYRAHGLPSDGGAADRWFRVRIGPLSLRLPNPPARRRALFFHDVNHVTTGYNTRFGDGEMAIAGFEVGAGCGRFRIAWYINLCMFALGLVYRPRTIARAFLRGRNSVSIYHNPPAPEVLALLTVADVRQRLRLDAATAAPRWSDYFSLAAWGLVAAVVLLGPAALILGALVSGIGN